MGRLPTYVSPASAHSFTIIFLRTQVALWSLIANLLLYFICRCYLQAHQGPARLTNLPSSSKLLPVSPLRSVLINAYKYHLISP
ncbi:hypothetical protein B0O99DRAFT_631236 [Bisporella sp. PMI_857]|nr:hypothetical protein B0O99DRAFT_631236 [Bisporella sp. PMI_857]